MIRYLAIGLAACLLVACWPEPAPRTEAVSPVLPDPGEGVVADRFARLALQCVHREYLNKISHVMNGTADAAAPRERYLAFLPQIPINGTGDWRVAGVERDPPDGKRVRLDGVNLSRAGALEGIVGALPGSETQYAGGHWLARLATYLETRRGIGLQ